MTTANRTITLQDIKKAVLEINDCFYGHMYSDPNGWANYTYEETVLFDLKDPEKDSFGGKLWNEFTWFGKRRFCKMSEKQAFWIALAFCEANNLEPELVARYSKH